LRGKNVLPAPPSAWKKWTRIDFCGLCVYDMQNFGALFMTQEKLDSAIQLIQSGQKQAAVPVLREIIQENPAQEDVWFLLSTCMDQVEHKKFCLQNVLKINPANQQARDVLAALDAPVVPAPVAWTPPPSTAWETASPEKTEWIEEPPEKFSWERTASESVAWQEEGQQGKKADDWQRTEPEEEIGWIKSQPEKFEWDQEKMEPIKMDWEEEAQPVRVKPVQLPSRPIPRRKTRRKRFSFFPVVAALVLFTMLAFVCFVFVMQVLTIP
jgi:hypothetical protein